MLPDFIKVKRDLSLRNSDGLSSAIEQNSLLSKIRKYRIHEGNRWTLYREDGSQETKSPQSVLSEVMFDLNEINRRGEAAIREVEYKAGSEVREKSHKLLFDRLDETLEATGNSIDMGGRPLTAEALLEMHEAVDFSFDDDGKWERPEFYPQTEKLKKELERLEAEPHLKKRLNEIIERKKEQWDVRQANRKLVD